MLALSLISGELAGWSPAQLTPRGAVSVLFLVTGGTVLGFGAYTWLLRVTTPAAVGDLRLRESGGRSSSGLGGGRRAVLGPDDRCGDNSVWGSAADLEELGREIFTASC